MLKFLPYLKNKKVLAAILAGVLAGVGVVNPTVAEKIASVVHSLTGGE